MNTFDRIDALLKEQKRKQNELTAFLGIPKSQYTDWKTQRTKSYTKHIQQIATFFNVSVDYLVGNTDNKNIDNNQYFLTEQEKTLLDSFRGTTELGRQKIIQSVLNICDEIEKNNSRKDQSNAG